MKATSACHLEADEVRQVVVDGPAVFHRLHNGGEVVVSQDHHGSTLGHLGARDAHRHANVSLLQGRRVIDAVTGHGDDVFLFLQHGHQADLVLRRHARHDADIRAASLQLGVAHRRELGAGQGHALDALAHARWLPPSLRGHP